MIVNITPDIESRHITAYRGLLVGQAIMGANIVRDIFASIVDLVGGRSGTYEAKLADVRNVAAKELKDAAR